MGERNVIGNVYAFTRHWPIHISKQNLMVSHFISIELLEIKVNNNWRVGS